MLLYDDETVKLMIITAVVDRIENDIAVLLSDGIEISIPVESLKGLYREGETVSLAIDGNYQHQASLILDREGDL